MALFLHTRIRVGNLDRSIQWYSEHFGFKLKSRTARSPAGNQVAHLELPGNAHGLELTYSPDYQLKVPEDLMHFAIGVPDLVVACDKLEKAGLVIWPDEWRKLFASGGLKMAFVTDPDGYEMELLEVNG